MSKFKIRVTVKAECSYEVEVEASAEHEAEDAAARLWRDRLPDDFQVAKGYITDWETETEQLTAICPECGVEHDVPHDDTRTCHCADAGGPPHIIINDKCVPSPWWREDQEFCAACGAKEGLK
jgi:hypothetical protein